MVNNITKIINEELNNFDFLGIENKNNSIEINELLSNPELQKQFICDSIEWKNIKIKSINDASLYGDFEEITFNEKHHLDVEYEITIEYNIGSSKSPLTLILSFNGSNIAYSYKGSVSKGDYWTPSETIGYLNDIEWNNIDVQLFDNFKNEIKFDILENSPYKIYELFIKSYLEDFICDKSGISMYTSTTNLEKSKTLSKYE